MVGWKQGYLRLSSCVVLMQWLHWCVSWCILHWMHLVCIFLLDWYNVKGWIWDACFITGTVLQINEIRWKVVFGEFKRIDLPYPSYWRRVSPRRRRKSQIQWGKLGVRRWREAWFVLFGTFSWLHLGFLHPFPKILTKP